MFESTAITCFHLFVRLRETKWNCPVNVPTCFRPGIRQHVPFSVKMCICLFLRVVCFPPSPLLHSAVIWHNCLPFNTLEHLLLHDAFLTGKVRRKNLIKLIFMLNGKYKRPSVLCLKLQHMQLLCTSERSLQSSAHRYRIIHNSEMQISMCSVCSDSKNDGYWKKNK